MSLIGTVFTAGLLVLAVGGSIAGQMYATGKATGFRYARTDLQVFLIDTAIQSKGDEGEAEVKALPNYTRASGTKLKHRYMMCKTAAAVLPTGNVPDENCTSLKPGDGVRLQFKSTRVRTKREPDGLEYTTVDSS